jgi:hypothetical protein
MTRRSEVVPFPPAVLLDNPQPGPVGASPVLHRALVHLVRTRQAQR